MCIISAIYWPTNQIFTTGASGTREPTDRFTHGLTYFSRLEGRDVKLHNVGPTKGIQIAIAAHRQ